MLSTAPHTRLLADTPQKISDSWGCLCRQQRNFAIYRSSGSRSTECPAHPIRSVPTGVVFWSGTCPASALRNGSLPIIAPSVILQDQRLITPAKITMLGCAKFTGGAAEPISQCYLALSRRIPPSAIPTLPIIEGIASCFQERWGRSLEPHPRRKYEGDRFSDFPSTMAARQLQTAAPRIVGWCQPSFHLPDRSSGRHSPLTSPPHHLPMRCNHYKHQAG